MPTLHSVPTVEPGTPEARYAPMSDLERTLSWFKGDDWWVPLAFLALIVASGLLGIFVV
jgi:hypothetical protein